MFPYRLSWHADINLLMKVTAALMRSRPVVISFRKTGMSSRILLNKGAVPG